MRPQARPATRSRLSTCHENQTPPPGAIIRRFHVPLVNLAGYNADAAGQHEAMPRGTQESAMSSCNLRSNQIIPTPPTGKTSPSGADQPATLRLHRPDEDRSDAIPFDRRLAVRRTIRGHVTAVRREEREDGACNRICALNLLDMSSTGLGAFCQEPIPDGATITVFFPPHGADRGFDAYGKVLRCDAVDGRYRVGIEFVGRAAA
jgi:hypothetical protein